MKEYFTGLKGKKSAKFGVTAGTAGFYDSIFILHDISTPSPDLTFILLSSNLKSTKSLFNFKFFSLHIVYMGN